MENRGLANVIRGHVGLTSIRYNNYFTKETGGSCIVFGGSGKDERQRATKNKEAGRKTGPPRKATALGLDYGVAFGDGPMAGAPPF